MMVDQCPCAAQLLMQLICLGAQLTPRADDIEVDDTGRGPRVVPLRGIEVLEMPAIGDCQCNNASSSFVADVDRPVLPFGIDTSRRLLEKILHAERGVLASRIGIREHGSLAVRQAPMGAAEMKEIAGHL